MDMSQLNLITFTPHEFKTVAHELGERVAPYFAPPNRINVIRTDLIGISGSGKSTFQLSMARPMMFGNMVTAPTNYNDELAYSFEAQTAAGVVRQAIFVDSRGLDYIVQKRDIPERTAPGPLFVQHPACDKHLTPENAAKIDTATQVTVSLIRYADNEHSITMNVDIPNFPMDRLVGRLIQKNIITPPRRKLNHVVASR